MGTTTRVVLVYYPLQVLIIHGFKIFVNKTQVQATYNTFCCNESHLLVERCLLWEITFSRNLSR